MDFRLSQTPRRDSITAHACRTTVRGEVKCCWSGSVQAAATVLRFAARFAHSVQTAAAETTAMAAAGYLGSRGGRGQLRSAFPPSLVVPSVTSELTRRQC